MNYSFRKRTHNFFFTCFNPELGRIQVKTFFYKLQSTLFHQIGHSVPAAGAAAVVGGRIRVRIRIVRIVASGSLGPIELKKVACKLSIFFDSIRTHVSKFNLNSTKKKIRVSRKIATLFA
jgi:hypothetical protein